AHAERAARFTDGDTDGLAGNGAATESRLPRGDRQQRIAVDRFDEPVAERVQGRPQRARLVPRQHMFLRGGVDGSAVNQRPAGMIEEAPEAVRVAGTNLGDLADAAAHRVLVALAARLRVVDGAEAFGDRLLLVEDLTRGVERRLGEDA